MRRTIVAVGLLSANLLVLAAPVHASSPPPYPNAAFVLPARVVGGKVSGGRVDVDLYSSDQQAPPSGVTEYAYLINDTTSTNLDASIYRVSVYPTATRAANDLIRIKKIVRTGLGGGVCAGSHQAIPHAWCINSKAYGPTAGVLYRNLIFTVDIHANRPPPVARAYTVLAHLIERAKEYTPSHR